jgi:hypothetical protein
VNILLDKLTSELDRHFAKTQCDVCNDRNHCMQEIHQTKIYVTLNWLRKFAEYYNADVSDLVH